MPKRKRVLLAILCVVSVSLGCSALQKQKELAKNHLTMGIAHLEEKQDSQALRYFLEAEALDPGNERIHYFKSFVYINKGMLVEAKASLQRAIELNPRYSQARTFIGSLYLREGKYYEAIQHFQEALANPLYDAPAAALYNMSWAFFYKGEPQKAISAAKKSLETDPDSPLYSRAHSLLGKIYMTVGDYRAAAMHYEKATASVADDVESLLGLAQARTVIGQKEDARSLLERVVVIDKEGIGAARAKEMLHSIE